MTRKQTIVCVAAMLAMIPPAARAGVITEKQIDAPPPLHLSVEGLAGNRGAIVLRLRADFASVNDAAPRHVFHLWADPANRIDATYNPVESRLEVVWTADTRRTLLTATNLYWNGTKEHELRLAWQDRAIELFVDGHPAAKAEDAPAMSAALTTLAIGRGAIGRSFDGRVISFALHDSSSPPPTTPAVDAIGEWIETPEELAVLKQFNERYKVAYLAHVRGAKGERQVARGMRDFEEYGIKMLMVGQDMIRAGWLEENRPDVLYGPGGGAATPDPEVLRLIREYISNGAGYFGICAGAVYAMDLGLLDASQRRKFSGLQRVVCRFDPTHPIFHNVQPVVPGEPHTAYYLHYSGPSWTPDAYPDAQALMTFDGGQVAMWAAPFGKGRVVVTSPHPEMAEWGQWRASERNALQQRRIYRNSFYHLVGYPKVATK